MGTRNHGIRRLLTRGRPRASTCTAVHTPVRIIDAKEHIAILLVVSVHGDIAPSPASREKACSLFRLVHVEHPRVRVRVLRSTGYIDEPLRVARVEDTIAKV